MDDRTVIEKALNERFLLQEEYLGNNKQVNRIEPVVSVTVATYQHVDYIKECLDGILMQETSFLYEVIIGEDGSIDGTQEICKEYAERYPDKIRLFIRDRNLSQYKGENGEITRFNGIWNRMSSRGKYIAWCEGDDYWVDPLKLQKQVEFLEKHLSYGLIYSRVNCFSQAKNKIVRTFGEKRITTKDLLLRGNAIPTLSVVFRKDLYVEYLKEIQPNERQWKMGDYPIWLWISHKASVKFQDEVTGVYRILEESASHTSSIEKRKDFICNERDIKMFFVHQFNLDKNYEAKINEHYIISLYKAIEEYRGDIASIRQEISKLHSCSLKVFIVVLATKCRFIRYCLRKHWHINP